MASGVQTPILQGKILPFFSQIKNAREQYPRGILHPRPNNVDYLQYFKWLLLSVHIKGRIKMPKRSNEIAQPDRRSTDRRSVTSVGYTRPERRASERRDTSEIQDPN